MNTTDFNNIEYLFYTVKFWYKTLHRAYHVYVYENSCKHTMLIKETQLYFISMHGHVPEEEVMFYNQKIFAELTPLLCQ